MRVPAASDDVQLNRAKRFFAERLQEQVYQTRLHPNQAPCFLQDGDHLIFRIRTPMGVDHPTPDWAVATFASKMQQSVPLIKMALLERTDETKATEDVVTHEAVAYDSASKTLKVRAGFSGLLSRILCLAWYARYMTSSLVHLRAWTAAETIAVSRMEHYRICECSHSHECLLVICHAGPYQY